MATETVYNRQVWLGGYNLTATANAVDLDYGAEMKDNTTMPDTTRSMAAGLKVVTSQVEGYWDADPYDAALFNYIGVSDTPMSIAVSSTEGSRAYFFKGTQGDYKPNGTIGEMFAFSAGAHARGDLVRGYVLSYDTSIPATANGTALQLGALSSDQTLVAALHVFSATGTNPTLDVTVVSDTASNFPSALTQLTFTQATGITSQYLTLAGANTDTWYRAVFTVGGTTPDFSAALVIGIL